MNIWEIQTEVEDYYETLCDLALAVNGNGSQKGIAKLRERLKIRRDRLHAAGFAVLTQ